MHQIAIFASGTGTNAARIMEHFKEHPSIQVALVVCNKPDAGVLSIARSNNINTLIIEKERFFRGDAYLPELKAAGISFIVLAGFLWKIPSALIQEFPGHMVNIHPALLPKYGGKGMYGHHVHEAVIAHQEAESGITIHYVDELYDHGKILFQESCTVEKTDTPSSLAAKINQLEYRNYARVIEECLTQKKEG
jgi:phosphoribosylglycinamide formyltransferase-1